MEVKMVKAILHGACGRMGHMIADIVSRDAGIEIVAGVDAFGDAYEYLMTMYASNAGKSGGEFYTPQEVSRLLALLGLVGKSEVNKVYDPACGSGSLLLQAAKILGKDHVRQGFFGQEINIRKLAAAGFDIEIVEKHHNQKLDAPSGTAIALADSINDAMDGAYDYVYDRSTRREKRREKEIGISAVRGGTIVGDHDVIFAGEDEVITFSHRAYSRAVFGKGAVEAAKYLAGKPAKLYTMHDVLA